MAQNRINLAVRFLLELAALAAIAYFGWNLFEGAVRIVPVIGLPIIAAAAWGVFAVPNDPSRSGNTVIAVNGRIRLGIEAAIFGAGVWALQDAAQPVLATLMAAAVVLHFAVSYDRIMWLLRDA